MVKRKSCETPPVTPPRAECTGREIPWSVDEKITAVDGTTVNDLVTYTLGDDAKTLEGVERQTTVGAKGGATNKWIYDKKSQ